MIKTLKDSDSIEDFMFDWSPQASTDRVTSSEWIVPAGLSPLAHSHTGTQTTVRLAGGESGQVYLVTNRGSCGPI